MVRANGDIKKINTKKLSHYLKKFPIKKIEKYIKDRINAKVVTNTTNICRI